MTVKLIDVFPDLVTELETLLADEGEIDLVPQVPTLQIVDRCRCGDDFCSTLYTEPKPEGSYGPDHRCIPLAPETGMIILDVLGSKIACVEVLYRDEMRDRLRAVMP